MELCFTTVLPLRFLHAPAWECGVYFSLSALLGWALANIMDHIAFFFFVPPGVKYFCPDTILIFSSESQYALNLCAVRAAQSISSPKEQPGRQSLVNRYGYHQAGQAWSWPKQVRHGPDRNVPQRGDLYLEVCFAAVESLKLQYDTPFKFTPPLTRGLSIWSWAGPQDGHLGPILPRSQPWVVLL